MGRLPTPKDLRLSRTGNGSWKSFHFLNFYMKLNRTLFWKLYHKSFDAHGPTTQKTVDALNAILDKFEVEKRLKYISWFAYCLATAYHETGIGGNHFVPVKEGKARPGTKAWDQYQSKYWGTGFYGRGLVQITHKENYLKFGKLIGVGDLFVQNPDLMLQIEYAYEAMVIGMVNGIYRGDAKGRKNLARYLKGDDASVQDYKEARDIINGDIKKNGLMIADYAEKFEHILKDSKDSAPDDITSATKLAKDPTERPTEDFNTGADLTTEGSAGKEQPPAPPTVEVKAATPSWTSRIGSGLAYISGLGISVGTFLQGKLEQITINHVIIIAILVGVGYAIHHFTSKRAQERTLKYIENAENPDVPNLKVT